MTKTKFQYECGVCGIIHDWEMDADDCCFKPTAKLTFYGCVECNEYYKTKREAFECCNQTKLKLYGV